jgi:hypothetical protein
MQSASRSFASLLVFILTFSAILLPQSAVTSLHGTVFDPKGAVVPGATVTINNPATGFSRSTQTDAQGGYQFVQLPPATYVVTTAAAGFATIRQPNVELLVNTPGTVSVTMQVSGGSETIEVTGSAPLVNTQDATLGHAFGADQIANLPFEGRDPTGILSLQPGVVFTGNSTHIDSGSDSRSGSVNGARSDQTNVVLDGVDNNDQLLGTAFQGALRVPLDSLEEFKVTTSNSDADTGRSSGGQVSLVTKGGTNRIHGTLYEYYRPTFTTANDWFNKQSQVLSGTPNVPPFLLRNTFGVAVGGPIKKDRLFYFLAYEGQRKREDLQVTRVVPSALLRQGTIQYPCAQDPKCPAGGVETLNAAQLASMDRGCIGNGSCPLGPGPSPLLANINGANPKAIFNQYPQPNSFTVGDGFDFQGYTFASPLPANLNAYVAKIDYNLTANGNHRLFVRGVLNNDRNAEAKSTDPNSATGDGGSQFSGQPAATTDHLNSKGLSVGYTATLSNTLVNAFHFGYIRAGIAQAGLQNSQFVNFRGLDDLNAFSPTTNTDVPVYNWVDDLTKVKGNHTMEFGGNLRRVDNIRESNSTSFFSAQTNALWLNPACIAGCGTSLDPGAPQFAGLGFPAVDPGFGQNYDYAVTALAGLISEVSANYNLNKSLAALPQGAMVPRHFRTYESEFYAQDKWQVKRNLTFTYGLRYTLLQPPYETNGTQVAPTTSLNNWFKQRAQNMLVGQAYEPLISFALSGQANGLKPYWAWDYKNLAPRFAIAYSPDADGGWSRRLWGGPGKTSIRAGYGIYFDHFGEGITNTFDRNGSFGLTTSISNTGSVQTVDTAARFTGLYNIPATSAATTGTCPTAPCRILEPPPSGSFPVTPPAGIGAGGFAVNWGLDDKLKTPYSHVLDFSIQRELPSNFVFEASYVGRFAHRLMQEEDLAAPVDMYDPKSGMDYFTAATLLTKQFNAGVPIQNVAPIAFWEHMFPAAAGLSSTQIGGECGAFGSLCGATGTAPAQVSATQAMYDLFAYYGGNATSSLQTIDIPGQVSGWPAGSCYPSCATINKKITPYAFYSPQFASLYSWRSIGNSAYNAGEFSLRRRMTHGLEFDINYTYSKSMDVGSDAERVNLFEGVGFSGQILNAWKPGQFRAVSDFDATHQINSNWVWELPVGEGKRYGSTMGKFLNAVVGGWTLSGLFRWSTGYPFSIFSPVYPVNWELNSAAVLVGKRPETGSFTVQGVNGPTPNVFRDPYNLTNPNDPNQAILQFRNPYPGESGQRNNFRGPGTFNVDSGLSKSWSVTEAQSIKFTWELFNVTNTPRFDVGTMQLNFNNVTSNNSLFGNFSSTLSNARVMEFALRYSF